MNNPIDDYFQLSENEWVLLSACFKEDRAGNLRNHIISTLFYDNKNCFKLKDIVDKNKDIAIQLLKEDISLYNKDCILFYLSQNFKKIRNEINKDQMDILFNFAIKSIKNKDHSLRDRSYVMLYNLYSYDIKKYRFIKKIFINQINSEYLFKKEDPYRYNPGTLMMLYSMLGRVYRLESYSFFHQYLEKYKFNKPSNRFIKTLVKKDGLNIYYSQKDLIRINDYNKTDWLKEKFYYFLIKEFFVKNKEFRDKILKTSFEKNMEFIIDHIFNLKLDSKELIEEWNKKEHTRKRLFLINKNTFKKSLLI